MCVQSEHLSEHLLVMWRAREIQVPHAVTASLLRLCTGPQPRLEQRGVRIELLVDNLPKMSDLDEKHRQLFSAPECINGVRTDMMLGGQCRPTMDVVQLKNSRAD
jgi:hypothetical protein